VVPNPVQGPSFQLAYQLLGDADQVRVRIYSAAMARVLDLDLGRRQRGPQLETVNLPPDLALGAYFLRLDVREGRQEQASKIVRFFRLNP